MMVSDVLVVDQARNPRRDDLMMLSGASIKVEQLLSVTLALGQSGRGQGVGGNLALLLQIRPAERSGSLGKLALPVRRPRSKACLHLELNLRVCSLASTSTDGSRLVIERRGDLTGDDLRGGR